MENHLHLPDEILLKIFTTLPAKSAARFRCLSTRWRAQLSSSQFAISHFNHRKEETTKNGLILVTLGRIQAGDDSDDPISVAFKVCSIPEEDAVSREIEVPIGPVYRIEGSCNGLALVYGVDDKSLLLLNPLNLRTVNIPDCGWAGKYEYHGLGYDSVSQDFKIVRFSALGDYSVFDVYSVRTASWKRVASQSQCSPVSKNRYPGVFMKDCVYWRCRASTGNEYAIVAFDLTKEMFSCEIPAPCEQFMLFVYGGCLSLVSIETGHSTREIWMLFKEYGWRKVASFETSSIPLFATEDNKIVCSFARDGSSKSLVYNLDDAVLETKVVNGELLFDGAAFVHSLFSPDHQRDV